MKNTLLHYMNRRFGTDTKIPHGSKSPGPVITISREPGCGGLKLAESLAGSLNEFVTCKRWQVISKEILQQSAKELELDPLKVKRVFTPNERSAFNEMLEAFNSRSYKSDRVILKAVRDVIHTFAAEGCCIILGRAGHEIAADLENALHIRLVGPMEWRVNNIALRRNIPQQEARELVVEMEENREAFRKFFISKKNPAEHYDLVIDVSRFQHGQVVQLIKTAAELKGLQEKTHSGISYF